MSYELDMWVWSKPGSPVTITGTQLLFFSAQGIQECIRDMSQTAVATCQTAVDYSQSAS